MGNLLDDIGNNIVVKKKRGVVLKWIFLLLPYVIIGSFVIGGAWYSLKGKFIDHLSNENSNSNDISVVKKEIKVIEEKVDKTNIRIDNTNERIDRIVDGKNK